MGERRGERAFSNERVFWLVNFEIGSGLIRINACIETERKQGEVIFCFDGKQRGIRSTHRITVFQGGR